MANRVRHTEAKPAPSFTGFGPDVLPFFAELDAHQTRDWFEANRTRYETEVRQPMASLVASLVFALEARDIPLTGDPRRSLFRIHRDIRFARNKRPYKTNVSAVLTRDGDKRSPGLLYVDIGLTGCFAALGFHLPEPDRLAAIREGVAAAPDRWAEVAAGLARRDLTLSRDHVAARLPRGFDRLRAAGIDDVLRLKSLTVSRQISHEQLASSELVDDLADFATDGLPLLQFGWSALASRPHPMGLGST